MKHSLSSARPGLFAAIASACYIFAGAGMLSGSAIAAEPAASSSPAAVAEANPDTGKKYAIVWRISGEVAADPGVPGGTRQLKAGDQVLVGERVRAAASGEAVLKTDDAGLVAIRPGTEFVAERFAADGKPSDRQTLRLISGSLRVISGWIGRISRKRHIVVTETATIGIRGTDHEPYALSAEMAKSTPYKPGTYDKVNRGSTTLAAGGRDLAIQAGRVGFALQPQKTKIAVKGLLTILFPVLLDKVPDFYVPGKFDAELDLYSKTSDRLSQQQLKERQQAAAAAEKACEPAAIARDWIGRFDRAIVRRDATAIIALFADDVTVRATVRGANDAMTSVDLTRDEMAQSTIASMKELKNFEQRRISLDASADDAKQGASCSRVSLRSVVIEQGIQAGKPYRFESLEEFGLELRDGKWLAVKAQTTQR